MNMYYICVRNHVLPISIMRLV